MAPNKDMRPKVLDLFAGAGGMALGFEAAGGRCVGAVEIDTAAARTFAHNFGHEDLVVFGGPEAGDVNQLLVPDLLAGLSQRPEVVVGGPPCQGFSRIGRAKQMSLIEDEDQVKAGARNPERNLLYKYFLGVVGAARPEAFVMENVPGMREMQGIDMTMRIRNEAQSLGYNVRCFMLNAAWYGVPQNRWRIFFVGLRRDLGAGANAIPMPPPRTHVVSAVPPEGMSVPDNDWFLWGPKIPASGEPEPAVSVREAFDDLPVLRSGDHQPQVRGQHNTKLPYRTTGGRYANVMRKWGDRVSGDEVTDNWFRLNARDFMTFERMAHGDRYPEALTIAVRLFRERLASLGRHAPRPGESAYEELKKEFVPPYRNDAFADKWRKLVPGEPSWTLTAHLSKDTYSHIHYDSRQARTITIREAARIQSFPDAFEFLGNNGQRYQQIGNAVPPLLARAIATQLFKQLAALRAERAKPTGRQWA